LDSIVLLGVLAAVVLLLPLAYFRVGFAVSALKRIRLIAYIWVGAIIVLAVWRLVD
jgi:hypothetical protein